jgi:methionyl-tRNA formyltransferase
MLANIDIFRALRFGNGNRINLVKRAWGRPLTQKVNVAADEATNLTSEVLSKFERLLLNILSRIVDQDFGAEMQLKASGTTVPKLERSKSIIDLNASEKLIG